MVKKTGRQILGILHHLVLGIGKHGFGLISHFLTLLHSFFVELYFLSPPPPVHVLLTAANAVPAKARANTIASAAVRKNLLFTRIFIFLSNSQKCRSTP